MISNTNPPLRTVDWKDNRVRMIDQTKLPNEFVYVEYNDFNQVRLDPELFNRKDKLIDQFYPK